MLENAEFIGSVSNKSVSVSPEMRVKLTDFSKAEIFKGSDFNCDKFNYLHQTQYNMCYFAPNRVSEEMYEARAADMWTVGMILFECVVGSSIYTSKDISVLGLETMPHNGYWAVMNGKIHSYLATNSGLNKMNPKILSVITKLLKVTEEKRMNSMQLLQSRWMSKLYKTSV